MKKILVILIGLTFSIPSKAIIHEILVWDGYMQFLPNNLTIQLGDTIQWLPTFRPARNGAHNNFYKYSCWSKCF